MGSSSLILLVKRGAERSCGSPSGFINGGVDRDLTFRIKGLFKYQGLMRRGRPHLTKWGKSVFTKLLANLLREASK